MQPTACEFDPEAAPDDADQETPSAAPEAEPDDEFGAWAWSGDGWDEGHG